MKDNIIDLLEFVLNNIKDESDLSSLPLSKLFGAEKSKNYMDVLNKEADNLDKALPENKSSFRYLLESEQMFFTKEVQGELTLLHSIGLISGKEIEQLIDIAIFREFRLIDKETLNSLLPSIIIENNSSSSSNIMLGNNTVN